MQHFVGVIIIFIKLTKTTRLLPDFTKAWKTMACRWGCRRAARWTPWLVAALGDEADDVYFIKLDTRRREDREDAAVDGDMELARTTPSLSSSSWRNGGRRWGGSRMMPPPCRSGSRRGFRQDDASVNFIKPELRRTKAWRLGSMAPRSSPR